MRQSELILAASQPNDIVGDIRATRAVIVTQCAQADAAGAALICFPECYLQGYVLDRTFVEQQATTTHSDLFRGVLAELALVEAIVVFGFIERAGAQLFNSAAVTHKGQLLGVYRKQHLLNSEQQVFMAGAQQTLFTANGLKFCIAICKDLNEAEIYSLPKRLGANLLVAPCNNMLSYDNAYVWQYKHNEIRQKMCRVASIPLLASDVTGKRVDKLALGPTALINEKGELVEQMPSGHAGLLTQTLTL